MTIITTNEASTNLLSLIDETVSTHKPIVITGRSENAVLLSESDWNAIAETLYLQSIPSMQKSIQEGMEEKISECSEDLEW